MPGIEQHRLTGVQHDEVQDGAIYIHMPDRSRCDFDRYSNERKGTKPGVSETAIRNLGDGVRALQSTWKPG
jgi:hypothetical protein